MPSDHPETIGPYSVRELLGKAGQSVVYKAADPRGRPVALKLFPARLSADPAAVERFHRELRSVAPVTRHAHLVHVLETGQEGDRLYLAMELVEGTSLDRILKQRRLSLAEVFTVMRGVCRGLAHGHQHGFVHRSLTPRNVLVSPDFGVVKVSDLGATGFEAAAPSLTATLSTGEIRLGALYYLPPEVLEGQSRGDARSDLYSAGVIFHEMLTGRSPGPKFALPSQIDPSLSQEIDVVVLRCLARRPDERYASAEDLLAALERLEETLRLRTLTEIRGISQAGSRLLGGTKPGDGGKKTFLVLGLALLILAVLAAAGYWLAR
ncbi:MAG TPA: serine/threonine-protein kinase [Thermoanaerobaculia bacterium]|jgi:serine/threonine-protein kinase|nr:serine/threonine-protein kinase [Thermoanaerobaculia bacterium]